MSCLGELPALADEELLDFLLKDDAPCPEVPGEENGLLGDWGLPAPELLDKEMDDFIVLLSPFEDEPGTLQGYSPAECDSGISEDQHLPHSPSSNFAGSPRSSGVQVDHSYSLHQDWPVLESVRSETAEGDVSIDLGTWTDLEGTSKALEQSPSFPVAVAVDPGPQLVPGTIMQSDFPELVLTEEERQLLEKEGVSLPTCLPLTKAEERLLKKVRRKIRNKQSAQDSRRRKKIYVTDLEKRVAVCTAQNHELEKKVELLQKQNMSLLEQLRKLQALVRQSTTKLPSKTCIMVVILSFCLILSPRICLFGSREPQLELRVLSRQIREFPNQVAPVVQEDAVLESFSPEPEDPSLLGSLNQSWEEGQSLPSPDPRSSFNSNSSSDPPLGAVGSELGPPQSLELHSQSDLLQAAVAWKAKRQEWVERTATVVVQQHRADEM
ncbi:LOW QUALITY PROTEIN: cyclic AMP-responsive element-binding protein 3 [Pterocles gutturalis]